jgi:hypothetical protein
MRRPIAPRIVDRDDQWITLRNRVQIKILRFRSEVRRPLGCTSVKFRLIQWAARVSIPAPWD